MYIRQNHFFICMNHQVVHIVFGKAVVLLFPSGNRLLHEQWTEITWLLVGLFNLVETCDCMTVLHPLPIRW
jgi:hypothetical protein